MKDKNNLKYVWKVTFIKYFLQIIQNNLYHEVSKKEAIYVYVPPFKYTHVYK